jgi:hypothetical protein
VRWILPALLACAAFAGITSSSRGAEPPSRLLAPADAVVLAYGDASTLTAEIASHTRYLWLPNLSAKERETWRVVLNGHVNQLSRETDLVRLRVVAGTDGHLVALNLLDYGWKADVWEQFAESDPTFSAIIVTRTTVEVIEDWPGGDYQGKYYAPGKYRKDKVVEKKTQAAAPWLVRNAGEKKAVEGLALLTHSSVPVVNALVFFANTASSGIGSPDYYDLQGVKNEKDFLALVGAEVDKDVAFSRDLLAAVGISGVTQEPRVIQRVDKRGGAIWSSFDKKKTKAVDRGNALRILGSDATGKPFLDFDATEKYAHGPNGLWKFYLGNAKGEKQARAPDDVAQDAVAILRNDHAVISCVSCIRCHTAGGLQEVDDWVRNFPPELDLLAGDRLGKKVTDYEDVKRLRQQYARKLDPFLRQDRERYSAALLEVTGLKPEKFAAEFARAWLYAADSVVDVAWAARELGVPPERVIAAVRHQVALGKADPVLAAFALPEAKRKSLPLSSWREAFGLMQQYLSECPP